MRATPLATKQTTIMHDVIITIALWPDINIRYNEIHNVMGMNNCNNAMNIVTISHTLATV